MPTIKCKKCRHLGVSVCGRPRCAFKRRPAPPGVHGPLKAARRRKLTDYGRQLMEKQKAKELYGIQEKQFRGYVSKATRSQGNTSVNLNKFLEHRLDNAVYRLGFAPTRRAARQLVSHGIIQINGKNVNIPSYQVKKGQVIGFKGKAKKSPMFESVGVRIENINLPSWLSLDMDKVEGKVTSEPQESDFERIFDAGQIIEFYSR